MALRIVTGVVLIAAMVTLVWWGPAWLLAAVAAAVAVLALIEFFALGERIGLRAFKKWTLACAVGMFYAQYAAGMVETSSSLMPSGSNAPATQLKMQLAR